MPIRVECYAGYRGEERPRAFFTGDRPIEVSDVLDRWRTPDCRGFRVRGDDGRVYILEQDVSTGEWELKRIDGRRIRRS